MKIGVFVPIGNNGWLIGVLKISPTISAIIFSYPVTWLLTALFFIGYYLYKQKKFS